jgi:hypothetical protein
MRFIAPLSAADAARRPRQPARGPRPDQLNSSSKGVANACDPLLAEDQLAVELHHALMLLVVEVLEQPRPLIRWLEQLLSATTSSARSRSTDGRRRSDTRDSQSRGATVRLGHVRLSVGSSRS